MKDNALKILNERFRVSKDFIFFETLDDDQFTFDSFLANAKALAKKWKKAGVKKGDTIVFRLPNSLALSCCYISCAIGGFIACPLGDYQTESVVEKLFEIIKPNLIVKKTPRLDLTLKNSDLSNCFLDLNQDSPFIYFFSAGTTGDPKIICHSLRSVIGSANAFAKLSEMSYKTRLYHILPMTYMAGFLNTMLAPLLSGGRIIEGPLFSPSNAISFWDRPFAKDVNTLSITPTIAVSLCKLTRSAETIAKVKTKIVQIQSTSAPIQKELRKSFYEIFSLPLQNCYGITELGGPLTFQSLNDSIALNDFSNPLSELSISPRGIEEQKELWIKSPFSMLGYLEAEGLVRSFDQNGYMDTGDLVILNEKQINIVGRKKDIIIRGGINISPARIENVIRNFSDIEIAVIGLDHVFWGEEIVVCVSQIGLKENHFIPRLKEYCHQKLSAHEIPDRFIIVEHIPKSFIGKVQKNILKKMILSKNL